MEYRVDEIVEINKNSLKKANLPKYIKYLDTANITKGKIDNVVNLDTKSDNIPSRARRLVQTDDIIISTVRPNQEHYGYIEDNRSDLTVSTGFAVLTPRKDLVNPYYLYLTLTTDQMTRKLQSIAEDSTSAYPSIKPSVIGNQILKLPSMKIQNNIATFFSNIDNKIDVNNKVIANLEELSQTLFKRWFVDFEFPNDIGEPYSSSGGEFVKSRTNDIPKNWSVVDLDEICEVRDGTHESPKETNKGFPLVTSKHLMYYQLDLQSAKLISKDDYLKVNERSKVHTNDILISMIGTIGRLYYVLENEINYAIKNIGLIKASQTNYPDYIYLSFKTSQIKNHIENRSAGSTQQYISLTELRKIPIINPPTEILGKFSIITTPIFKKIRNLVEENDKLIVLRDTLLPKLMSGEIELPDELEVDEHAELL